MVVDSETQKTCLNQQNQQYYSHFRKHDLDHYLNAAGLSTNKDLLLILPHIELANSILIVGGGFGREIDFIQAHNHCANISVVERNADYIDYMRGNHKNCTYFCEDILNWTPTEKFDVVLLLFGMIQEFSADEIPQLFEILAASLSKDGTVMIDGMASLQSTERFTFHDHNYFEMEHENCVLKANVYSHSKLAKLASHTPLKLKHSLPYITDTGMQRCMHQLIHRSSPWA